MHDNGSLADDSTRDGPDLSRPALSALMARRLDPWEYPPPPSTARSDLDLNPDLDLGAFEGLRSAAVLIGLIQRPAGLNVVLTRRADHLRRHRGQIAFPGGGVEAGETIWQAALREAHEEVGLDPSMVELAGISTAYKTLTGFHITPVVGFVDPAFVARPDPSEVAEVFETPFAFLMDAANHSRIRRTTPAGPERWVYSMEHNDRVIWGVSAAIVHNLWLRLYGPETP